MDQTFKRKSDGTTIVTIKGNVPPGQAHLRDGAVRHGVHVVAGGSTIPAGVLVEVESAAPTPRRGDRPVTLAFPTVAAADLTKLFDARDGVYGLPVVWVNSLIPSGIDALILRVDSKPWPGNSGIGTLNQRFRATVLIQPT